MRLLPSFLLTLVCFSSSSAFADRPNYTYLGLGYAYDRLDRDCEQDGLSLEGSLVINELSFVRVNHTDVTSSSWCGSTTSSFAGGVRSDIGGSSSVYATAALVHRDYGNNSETGLGADAGIRSIIVPGLEVDGFVGYEVIDDIEITYFGGGLNYWISRDFSLTATATVNDNNDKGIRVGLRFNL